MSDITNAMAQLEEDQLMELVEAELGRGTSALEILGEVNQGIAQVGEMFERGEYFISQLMFSAEILQAVLEKLKPGLAGSGPAERVGKVVIGTVAGDIHDIGKNIVGTLLEGNGFEVIDLGVDVAVDKFVAAVKDPSVKVLGLSALLSFTYPEMKKVVEALQEAGMRGQVKVIIGGAPVTEDVRIYSDADYYAKTAIDTVNICKEVYNDGK